MAILFAIELLHEKRKTLTQLTDRLPLLARGALYVLAILAIAVLAFGGRGTARRRSSISSFKGIRAGLCPAAAAGV